MMQRQMEKLEKDTYSVRKAEGRPKHGQTSFTILGVGVISWFMLVIAIVLPEWRSNWIGMMGYPHKRSWGLFAVNGMASKLHHEAMTDQCRYYSQLNIGGVCASPICLWYRMKCQIYMDIAMVSYTTAFFYFICLILHTLCLIWTMRMTPRMIKWAAIWWVAQIIIHFSIIIFWWMMTGESFASLDSQSMYPEPDFSFCFYLECLCLMCLCAVATLSVTLMKMWPETSSSGSDDDDSDETDSDNPRPKGPPGWNPAMGPPPGYPGGPPPPGYPGGPPMMGPPGGPGGPPPGYAGGPPPQGWDPSMGPPPPGGPQMMGPPGGPQMMGPPGGPPPGWDPSMGPPPGQPGGPPPGQQGGPPPQGQTAAGAFVQDMF